MRELKRKKSTSWLEKVLSYIGGNHGGISAVNKTTGELIYLDPVLKPESFNMIKSNISRYSDLFGFNSSSIFFNKIEKLSKEVNIEVNVDYSDSSIKSSSTIEFVLDIGHKSDVIYTKQIIEQLYSHLILEIKNIKNRKVVLSWIMLVEEVDENTEFVLSKQINMSVISAILSVLYTKRGGSSSNLRQLIPFLDEMMFSSILSSRYAIDNVLGSSILTKDLYYEYARIINICMRDMSDDSDFRRMSKKIKNAPSETHLMYTGFMFTYLISIKDKFINSSILLVADERDYTMSCAFVVPYDELIEEYVNYLYLIIGENSDKVFLLKIDKPEFRSYSRPYIDNKEAGTFKHNMSLCAIHADLKEWNWCASGDGYHDITDAVEYYQVSSRVLPRGISMRSNSKRVIELSGFRKQVKRNAIKIDSSKFESFFGDEPEEHDTPSSKLSGKQCTKEEPETAQYVTIYVYDVHMRCFVSRDDNPAILIKIKNHQNAVSDINDAIQMLMDASVMSVVLREYSTHAIGKSVYLVYTNNDVISPFSKGLIQHKTSVIEKLQINESSTKVFKDDSIFKIITK